MLLRHIVSLLAPRAVEMLLDRIAVGPEPATRSAEGPLTDLETRVQALRQQAEATATVHKKQIEEIAQALRVIGWRSTAALWLGVTSTVTALVGIALVMFRP
jgi:hypothetical protein